MKKIYIDNNIMVNEQYRRKIINFLKDYCDNISYATLLDDDYDLNFEEYSKAINDIAEWKFYRIEIYSKISLYYRRII